MEASQAGAAPSADQPPAETTEPPADASGEHNDGEGPAATPPAPAPPAEKDDNRTYSVLQELKLDVSSATAQKEAAKTLAELAHEGSITVFARLGKIVAPDPKKAVKNFAQLKPLNGDYEVIADSAVNHFPGVKTAQEVNVTFG